MKFSQLKEALELEKKKKNEHLVEQIKLFEHRVYTNIPGTRNSFRSDPANLNTRTKKHMHVFACPNGRGNELYAVNIDGSGHDGSSEVEISSRNADYFRTLGYEIDQSNILESLDFRQINKDKDKYILHVLLDDY